MAQHYSELQSHLDRVRQAWKRAAALQGLAAVIVEGLGMFLLFLLLDYIYVFPQTLRVVALALMGGIIAFLFFRHVVRPYTRVIPDEQVALYIEEREQATEGALLSATTFGKQAGATNSSNAIYGYIVENIVNSAVEKAGAIQLGRILNVAKLRKYAIAALIVLLFFGATALRYSSFFGKYGARMLLPWNMTDEDKKAEGSLIDPATRMSFELTLNAPKNRLLRGSALKVKAKLSQMPESDVILSFGTKGSGALQRLKMDEIDELNGFALRLPDVNDDIEIQVETGRPGGVKSVSDRMLVTVYDPLEIKGYEVTLCPPAYTKQKATTDFGPAADITALQGTVVKFRALANAPLASGTLVFDDGSKVALTGEKNNKDNAAGGEFTVGKDDSYTVRVIGADEQKSEPSSTFTIKMTKDEPPTIAVVYPGSDMSAHALTEVEFKVKAADDVGIGNVELVYSPPDAEGKSERLPIKLESYGPGEHEASVLLALADVKPTPKVGSTLFYHFEIRDLKGQTTISDIFSVAIRPYEIAGAFPATGHGGHHSEHHPPFPLMLFTAAAWNIHMQKDLIEKAEYNQRCDDLAGRMAGYHGSTKGLTPEQAVIAEKGSEFVLKGIEKLKEHDAGGAVALFQQGITLLQSVEVKLDKVTGGNELIELGEVAANTGDPMKDALGFLKMDNGDPMWKKSPHYNTPMPDYRRIIKPDEARKLIEAAENIRKQEEKIVETAKQIASAFPDPNGTPEQKRGEPKETEDNPDPAKPTEKKPGQAQLGEPKLAAALGENKPDENKPGDNKPGEKPAEQKDGKPTAGAANAKPNNGETKPGEGKTGAAHKPDNNGEPTADRNERVADLQRRQEALAGQSRKLEQQLAENAANADKSTKEIIEHFRNSTKQMEAAVAQMKQGNLQRAAARGEEAKKELHAAADKLQLSQYDNLDKAVEEADQRGAKIAEVQKQIREGMQKVLDDAAARNKTDPQNNKGGDPKLNPQDLAKLQGLARMQIENQKNAEDLEKNVGDLEKWADDTHKKETGDELRKAARIMKQDNVASTMVTAAVNLGQQETVDAKESQDKLDKTLNKLTGALHSANSSLAATHEQKLKRALGETKDIIAKAEMLAGIPHEDKDGKNAGRKGVDNKPDAENGGKNGEKRTGDDKNAGNSGRNDAEHKDETKTADANKNDANKPNADKKDAEKGDKGEKGDTGDKVADDGKHNPDDKAQQGDKGDKGEKEKELSSEERKQLEGELLHDTQRLAKRLDEDKLADGPIQGQIQTVTSDKSFEEMFKEGQKTQLDRYLGTLRSVSSHLEGKLESVLKAKRLSAAQREQTPPQYRDMVNKYYEQLAKE